LLPLATGAGIFLLLDHKSINTKPALLAAAGVFGVFVTIGLFFYERRGMVECFKLRDRGTNLESGLLLGKDNSQFINNQPDFVGPQGAGPIVYFAVIAGWLFVVFYGFMKSSPGWQIGVGASIFVAYLIALRIAFLEFYYNRGPGAKNAARETKQRVATTQYIRQFFRRHRSIPSKGPNPDAAANRTSDGSASYGS
jgi:hypothetical protein